LLQVDRLSFRYGSLPVFEDVGFSLKEGELCAILGINGSGKSTLFKCIMGFLSPQGGSISFGAQDIKQLRISDLAKRVAYVPQDHPVTFPFLVREMVLMGRTTHMSNFFDIAAQHHSKVEEALKTLGLEDLADKPFGQLSGGQRQMVLIARALAQETKLMLLDEPTASLDFKNQLLIWNMLSNLRREGKSVLVCTHDPNHVLWFCDRVLVMDGRRLVADGHPSEVLDEQTLRSIYGPMCNLREIGGNRIVLPSLSNRS
jgi:iron complex transport system ATP-binding protein